MSQAAVFFVCHRSRQAQARANRLQLIVYRVNRVRQLNVHFQSVKGASRRRQPSVRTIPASRQICNAGPRVP